MKRINVKTLLLSLVPSLAVGGLAALLTGAGGDFYETVNKPALSPPPWLFPVVWTVLYILMGVSLCLVTESGRGTRLAYLIYSVQLAVNFVWSLVFFNSREFLAAAILIVVLWALILAMIVSFRKIRPAAAYLQLPYFFWVTFASYLAWAIYRLN